MMEIENKTVHTPREKGKKISTQPAGRRLIKKKTLGWEVICRTAADTVKPWAGRFFLFPALILYLELVLHFYMGMEMRYAPVYFAFSLAAGCLFSALILVLPPRAGNVTIRVAAGLVTLLYGVELVAKSILQTYYPLSILGTASGNRLTDYANVIAEQVAVMVPVLALLLLPFVLLLIFFGRKIGDLHPNRRLAGLALAAAAAFHLLGVGIVHLPWQGDLTPGALYQMDSAIDDQVEQLGLWTMLRLDVQHMIIPPKSNLSNDFSAIEGLGSSDDGGGTGGADSAGSTAPAEPEEPAEEEPVVDTSPNVMDVDLAALAESTSSDSVAWLANYFNSVAPTNKNEYTGMFEGYNVIQVVMEGFSGYAIDPELTPTLYKLAHEGFVFNNYYTALHFTSTSNGECQTLLGLYPKNGSPITMKRTGELGTNVYFSLAQQLGRLGYQVYGYHNNQNMYGRYESHTNLGYTWKQYVPGRNDDPDTLTCEENSSGTDRLWPQRDKYMVEMSVDDYINSDAPFHVYYLTVSGHTRYGWNRVANQYKDLVSELPYSETTQAYVAAAAIEVDRALEYLIQRLDEAGKLENTLIIATGDHIPYSDVDVIEELAGREFGTSEALSAINESAIDFDVYKNTLIMWSASMAEPVEVDKVCCQVDILPTVSNLLGLEYDSRMLAGSDILSDSEGLVVFSSRCWRTDRGFYNRFTQTFTPAEGVVMTAEEQAQYVEAMKTLVGYKLDSTARIVENDFYDIVFGETG